MRSNDDEPEIDPLAAAIVRLRTGSTVSGAGVLLAPDRIATCAHAVASALGASPESTERHTGSVRVEFPLVDGAPTASAEVADWQPIRADGRGDVAILRMLEPAPQGALPAPARVTGEVWRHPFRVFGFPHGHDDGVWVRAHEGSRHGSSGQHAAGRRRGGPDRGVDAPGDRRVGRGNAVERATETMQDAMGRIRPAAQAVLDEFRAMDTPPAKVNVQFGIKATGEASLAVAKTAGEANFTVTLEWDGSTLENA